MEILQKHYIGHNHLHKLCKEGGDQDVSHVSCTPTLNTMLKVFRIVRVYAKSAIREYIIINENNTRIRMHLVQQIDEYDE